MSDLTQFDELKDLEKEVRDSDKYTVKYTWSPERILNLCSRNHYLNSPSSDVIGKCGGSAFAYVLSDDNVNTWAKRYLRDYVSKYVSEHEPCKYNVVELGNWIAENSDPWNSEEYKAGTMTIFTWTQSIIFQISQQVRWLVVPETTNSMK